MVYITKFTSHKQDYSLNMSGLFEGAPYHLYISIVNIFFNYFTPNKAGVLLARMGLHRVTVKIKEGSLRKG